LGWGYYFANVEFDDCEHSTGTAIEIKEGYERFLGDPAGRELLKTILLAQATRQVAAAGTRPVRWYFSQKKVADFAAKIFSDAGLEKIDVRPELWPGSKK